MPPVSVVIPALNEEDSIGACLDCLTQQAGAADEIIVLDNGSTDRTAPIADSFDGVRVIHAPDSMFDDAHYRGLAALRQLGAEQASNEIIATTDADTLPPADWLDRIKAHFDADPELTVLWGVTTDTNGVPVRDMTGKYLTFLGGVSGCNTAFRKAAFERSKKGYTGWPMFEDVALITRLARTGKAVHDTSLEMRTDLDRRRYQTIPMLATGGAGVGSGLLLGGAGGALASGVGAGLAGTELVYEALPKTRLHHDQVGMGLMLAGLALGGGLGLASTGLGAGVLAHHLLTEGASAVPTTLFQNTDQVCRLAGDDGEELVVRELACEPRDEATASATRVLAAATAGGLAATAIGLVRG